MNKRILLLSSSYVWGGKYLDYAESEIRDFLGTAQRLLFIPYALKDYNTYTKTAHERFDSMGYELHSIHQASDPRVAVETSDVLFIGGGNTFRLLKTLYDLKLLTVIRDRVENGMRYIGSSAGSNVAGPTIKTTNDMPIVEVPSLKALHLVSFQINPHYLDPDPNSTHLGETREERLRQFHEENDTPVIGLREGAMLRVEGASVLLKGIAGARIFRKGTEPAEVVPVCELKL